MDEITTIELTKVLLPTPEAQLRYLQRLDARYYFEFKQATPANFQALLERMEASEAAIQNFSPVAHMEAVRARLTLTALKSSRTVQSSSTKG